MSDFNQRLASAKEDLLAFKTSKVWELWLEYAKGMKKDFEMKAIKADTLEKREYARMSYMAFEQFEQIPFVLVQRAETLSQETVPKDLL